MASKLLMFLMILYIAFGTVTISQKRGIQAEPVIFEVLVNAPCEAYMTQAMNSIQISRVQSNPTCLPISPVDPANDVNDYHAHIFCTNVDGGQRSLFRFHEIFAINEDETPAPGDKFIVSWVNNRRFREHTSQYTYLRRPSCSIGNDVCSPTQIVNECWDNSVDIDGGFVDSNDRIYFIPPGVTSATCTLNGGCCPYISLTNLGLCGGTAPNLCQGVNCDDNNACTIDSCNPSTGLCSNVAKNCDDNKFCTTDSCDALTGLCSHTPVSCDDNNACTIDSCVEGPTSSTCSNVQMVCNDGNPCTDDICISGVCTAVPKTCTPSNNCDVNGRCDALTGNCIFDAKNCNDNDVCTLGDFCDRTLNNGAGGCTSASQQDCGLGSDRCHYAVCDAVAGCQDLPLSCFDGKSCTLDTCNVQTGQCTNTQFCASPYLCFTGVCINERCDGNSQNPCPPDNGTQTFNEYCKFNDRCTPPHVCNSAKNCCSDPVTGLCKCNPPLLC